MSHQELTPGKALYEVRRIIQRDVDYWSCHLSANIISFVVRKNTCGDLANIHLVSTFISALPDAVKIFVDQSCKTSILKFWKKYLETKDHVTFFNKVLIDLGADGKLAVGLGVTIYNLANTLGLVTVTGSMFQEMLSLNTQGQFVPNYAFNGSRETDPHPDRQLWNGDGTGLYQIWDDIAKIYRTSAFNFKPIAAWGWGC
jgi:hypothetical protein